MPVHITMNDAVTRCADYLLARQDITAQRKDQIFVATKYNLLVKAYNSSTVMLVAGAVMAVFLAFSSSFVLLSLGLFLRFTTERELEKYAVPYRQAGREQVDQQQQRPNDVDNQIRVQEAFNTDLLRHALQQTTEAEKVVNIFRNIALPLPPEWNRNEVTFLDFDAWKNPVPIPDQIVAVSQPEPVENRRDTEGASSPQRVEPEPRSNNLASLVRSLVS